MINLEDYQNAIREERDQESAMKALFFLISGSIAATWCWHQVGGWEPVWPRVAIVGSFMFVGWLGSLFWKLWLSLIGLGVIVTAIWGGYWIMTK